ncbi:flagellar filament capping protein FliD [Chitinimonas koreensis]|uniref:flagellar filament capping protein FliD n=1 Tax=Chitinimonas koreensis TaxID=356302 RepID=UPI0004001B0E|nr:flagellar filament capping protein FliD [Chitinimonas koreensis]QNM98505.1 flagellar filament capping protein FliD [Chitinimonas koreensis]
MAITSSGLGSGLDINGIISQLMLNEQQPLTKLATQEASYQSTLSSLGSVRGALSAFQGAVSGLTDVSKFNSVGASASDASVASASASSIAVPGSYSLKVNALAQNQKLKSGLFNSVNDTFGTGKITIQFGKYDSGSFTANADKAAVTIDIDSSKNSLAGVRDAINAAKAGVTASIVNDGSGNRLVLSSNDSGVQNALKVSVDDDDANDTDTAGLSRLAYDASTGGTQNLTQTQAALNADFLVDGIPISKSSNTVTDAIQGVTLKLQKAQDSGAAPITVSVSRDSGTLVSAVDSFVKGYNDLAKVLGDMTAYNAETKAAGPLQGDATVRGLQSQLRAVLNGKLPNNTFSTLSQLGIAFNKEGALQLDKTKLQKAIDTDSASVLAAFGAYGVTTNSKVQYVSAGKNAIDGSYAVSVTQPATRGQLTGAAVSVPTVTASNNTFNIKVDGTVSGTITLAAGTYTSDQLAAEMQSKINGDNTLKNAGKEVSVTYEGGQFVISSKRYGDESKVDMGTGAAGFFTDFGFTASQAGVAGLDVAGTVGGQAATGDGQYLTAKGGADGIKLLVSTDTAGEYGNLNFSKGFAFQLNKTLDDMLSTKGSLAARTDGVNRSIKDIDKQRDTLNTRLTATEARYRAEFTALDTLISGMKQTSTYLSQQLANLPKVS